MKKFICVIICVLLSFSFAACSAEVEEPELSEEGYSTVPTTSGIESFNFLDYESKSGLSSITEVQLSQELAGFCKTYKFVYTSLNELVAGYISIPLSCIESGVPYKCIVYNRGGNSEIGLLTDGDTARICAATNRVVVASQYRGAGISSGVDEFGGNDLQDVISLIDLCQYSFAFADITDLCVAGVSRGGMMSYMAARADSRIKRIIAISAVTDLKKAYNDREDMKEILDEYIGGSPDDLPEEYEKRSAICWADEITVPTLIIHSKEDEQVSYSQATEMYVALANNGTVCTLQPYDDSTHGFHAEDITLIAQWLGN